MSYNLLLQILAFEEERENYSPEDQERIEKELKGQVKKAFKAMGRKLVSTLDVMNEN